MPGAAEIRAARAYVSLGTKDSDLVRGLKSAEQRVRACLGCGLVYPKRQYGSVMSRTRFPGQPPRPPEPPDFFPACPHCGEKEWNWSHLRRRAQAAPADEG